MEITRDVSNSVVLEVERDKPLGDLTVSRQSLSARRTDTVILAVERFSVSANNLGYILFNDVLQTLEAFPSPTRTRARVPVWGTAEVVDADPSVVAVGTRVAGFLPMATHVAVRVTLTETGLLSVDERRRDMLPFYRRLTPVANSSPTANDLETVLLPIYPFAALLAADVVSTGVRTVIASSASSRSAAGLSRLLVRAGIGVIGLTSAKHRSSAEAFGVYERVLGYDEVDRINPTHDTAYVDVAGSADVTDAVHDRLGRHLVASIGVGATHARSSPAAPAPPLVMFNTADRESQLVCEHGWQAVRALYEDARADLIPWASKWMKVTTVDGLAGALPVWREIVNGHSDPLSATVIRP